LLYKFGSTPKYKVVNAPPPIERAPTPFTATEEKFEPLTTAGFMSGVQ